MRAFAEVSTATAMKLMRRARREPEHPPMMIAPGTSTAASIQLPAALESKPNANA